MPTTEEVRDWLGSWRPVDPTGRLQPTHREQFDQWLDEHDRQVRSEVIDWIEADHLGLPTTYAEVGACARTRFNTACESAGTDD